LLHPSAAPADVSQLIDLRGGTVDRSLSAISRSQGALTRGLGSFIGRARTIIGRSRTIGRSASTIVGRPLTIAGLVEGPLPLLLALGLQGRPRMVARRLASVSHLREPIALGGRLIALIRGDLSRYSSSQPRMRLLVAHMHRMLAMQASRPANLLVGRERFQIAGGLILLRSALVGVRGRLVAVGVGLIAVGGRLVAV
jgi:hypothetical protein